MDTSTGDFPASPSVTALPQMANKPPAMEKTSGPQYPARNAGYDTEADTELTLEQASNSDIDDDDIYPVVVRPKAKVLPPLNLSVEPLWLLKGQAYILNQQEGLDVPFPKASDTTLRNLEEAEKTKGGLRNILGKLMDVGYRAHLDAVAREFDVDAEDLGNPGDDEPSHDILECARRVMVLQERVWEQSTAKEHTTKGRQERLGLAFDEASKDKIRVHKKSAKGKGKAQDPGELICST